jgi:hypothetical protein
MLFFAMRKYILTAVAVWVDKRDFSFSPGPQNEHVSNCR